MHSEQVITMDLPFLPRYGVEVNCGWLSDQALRLKMIQASLTAAAGYASRFGFHVVQMILTS